MYLHLQATLHECSRDKTCSPSPEFRPSRACQVIFAKRMTAPGATQPPVSMLERIAAMPPIDVSGDLLEIMNKAAAKKVRLVLTPLLSMCRGLRCERLHGAAAKSELFQKQAYSKLSFFPPKVIFFKGELFPALPWTDFVGEFVGRGMALVACLVATVEGTRSGQGVRMCTQQGWHSRLAIHANHDGSGESWRLSDSRDREASRGRSPRKPPSPKGCEFFALTLGRARCRPRKRQKQLVGGRTPRARLLPRRKSSTELRSRLTGLLSGRPLKWCGVGFAICQESRTSTGTVLYYTVRVPVRPFLRRTRGCRSSSSFLSVQNSKKKVFANVWCADPVDLSLVSEEPRQTAGRRTVPRSAVSRPLLPT